MLGMSAEPDYLARQLSQSTRKTAVTWNKRKDDVRYCVHARAQLTPLLADMVRVAPQQTAQRLPLLNGGSVAASTRRVS